MAAVRSARVLALQRRDSWRDLKAQQVKAAAHQRYQSELQKCESVQQLALQLEREEAQLIQQLQRSQTLMSSAYEELERAQHAPLN